jgi:predicted membrane protein
MTSLNLILALILVGAAAWFINLYSPMAGKVRTALNVVLTLIVVGAMLWLVNNYVPMAGSIRAILNIVVVVGICLGAESVRTVEFNRQTVD